MTAEQDRRDDEICDAVLALCKSIRRAQTAERVGLSPVYREYQRLVGDSQGFAPYMGQAPRGQVGR